MVEEIGAAASGRRIPRLQQQLRGGMLVSRRAVGAVVRRSYSVASSSSRLNNPLTLANNCGEERPKDLLVPPAASGRGYGAETLLNGLRLVQKSGSCV